MIFLPEEKKERPIMIRVALIRGGMYDTLYSKLPEFIRETGTEVEVGFQGDHPALNAHLAGFGSDIIPYDLVSTHTKYAPSQTSFLAPLDEFLSPADLEDFVPLVLNLARIEGSLYSLPRNIDVRLLHYRTDLLPQPPQTWDELLLLARQAGRQSFTVIYFPAWNRAYSAPSLSWRRWAAQSFSLQT
jgi:multiple sugar transport system substrate-binding protein